MAPRTTLLCLAFAVAAGCGFRGLSSSDGPTPALDLAGVDFAGVDFAGVDLAAVDLAVTQGGGTGAGPLGALPSGVCCSANEQCAGRHCLQIGTGDYFCSKFCTVDTDCNWFAPLYRCDTSVNLCAPVNTTYSCVDPSTYHYGALPTGACCSPGPKSDQQCAGGLCIGTGLDTNPLYCSQGCNNNTPCPSGYTCFSRDNGFLTDIRDCWKNPTATDQTATYTCQ